MKPAALSRLADLAAGAAGGLERLAATSRTLHERLAPGQASPTPRILVLGASGYVGARLVDELVRRGIVPVLAGRDPDSLRARWPALEARRLDLEAPATIEGALAGIGLAYYLAHAMDGRGDFARREKRAAEAFGRAAAGVGARIVYLGGLGDERAELSEHLASRQATGRALAAAGASVSEFRAAVIVGSGSASFEIIRHLVERLPVMITPRWVRTRVQPIGIDEVIAYLVAAIGLPEANGVVEIGGADVLTYGDMMAGYAAERGLRRLMIPVPVLTPRLSSYWVHLVSPVPAGLARPLVEGLRHEVVVRDPGPARAFGVAPLPYREVLRRALARAGSPESTWFDAVGHPRTPLAGISSREGMHLDRRTLLIAAPPAAVWAEVAALGGEHRWPAANALWAARGILDRLAGGPGLRRGRRDEEALRVGDALDFWRVEALMPDELLRLAAEMRLPGRGWLEYRLAPEGAGTRLVQTAYFEPRGLAGLAYWWAVLPLHAAIFPRMLSALGEHAIARRRADAGAPGT